MVLVIGPPTPKAAGNHRSHQGGAHPGPGSQTGHDFAHVVEGRGHPLSIVSQCGAFGRAQCVAAIIRTHLPVELRLGVGEQFQQPGLSCGIGPSIDNRLEEAPSQMDTGDHRLSTARG